MEGTECQLVPALSPPSGQTSESLVLYRSTSDPDDVIEVPWPLNRHLRPYQRQGIQFLFQRCFHDRPTLASGAILADEMGLGKTIQVIGLLSALLRKTQFKEVDELQVRQLRFGPDSAKCIILIVTPASVLENWVNELNFWGRFAHAKYYGKDRELTLRLARAGKLEVVLTTLATARNFYEDLNSVDFVAVIVDEVHQIKEPTSNVTVALKQLSCKRRIGLTGTLVQNKLEELWCVLDWANPNCLGSVGAFSSRYAKMIERGLRIDASKGELALARKLQAELAGIKNKYVLRRVKTKVIPDQLPKKVDKVIFCQPSSFQIGVFKVLLASEDMDFVLKGIRPCTCGKGVKGLDCCFKVNKEGKLWKQMILTFLHLFLKVANHAALLQPSHTRSDRQAEESRKYCQLAFNHCPELLDVTRRSSLEVLSNPKFSGKMQVLGPLLEVFKDQGHKVLLFSYSTRVLDILQAFVEARGYSFLRLDGHTKPSDRTELVNKFNTDSEQFIFLISTKAGGLGLNITGANVVVIFDPSWNPAYDLQAQDRAHRLGQTRNVSVYRLITAGCIEENKYLRQVYKQQLGKNTVDDENAKRYFQAARGEAKGELFGLENLLKVDVSGQSLTSTILKRNDEVEEIVKGKRKIQVRNDLFSYQSVNTATDENAKDEYDLETMVEDALEPDRLKAILESPHVVHQHDNQAVVGGSRVEDHLTNTVVERIHENPDEFSDPILANCEEMEEEEEEDPEEEASTSRTDSLEPLAAVTDRIKESTSLVRLRGDEPRTWQSSQCDFIYGQTPVARRRLDFEALASHLNLGLGEAAQHVLRLDWEAKAQLLQQFYESQDGYQGVSQLYSLVTTEYHQEQLELMKDEQDLTVPVASSSSSTEAQPSRIKPPPAERYKRKCDRTPSQTRTPSQLMEACFSPEKKKKEAKTSSPSQDGPNFYSNLFAHSDQSSETETEQDSAPNHAIESLFDRLVREGKIRKKQN